MNNTVGVVHVFDQVSCLDQLRLFVLHKLGTDLGRVLLLLASCNGRIQKLDFHLLYRFKLLLGVGQLARLLQNGAIWVFGEVVLPRLWTETGLEVGDLVLAVVSAEVLLLLALMVELGIRVRGRVAKCVSDLALNKLLRSKLGLIALCLLNVLLYFSFLQGRGSACLKCNLTTSAQGTLGVTAVISNTFFEEFN